MAPQELPQQPDDGNRVSPFDQDGWLEMNESGASILPAISETAMTAMKPEKIFPPDFLLVFEKVTSRLIQQFFQDELHRVYDLSESQLALLLQSPQDQASPQLRVLGHKISLFISKRIADHYKQKGITTRRITPEVFFSHRLYIINHLQQSIPSRLLHRPPAVPLWEPPITDEDTQGDLPVMLEIENTSSSLQSLAVQWQLRYSLVFGSPLDDRKRIQELFGWLKSAPPEGDAHLVELRESFLSLIDSYHATLIDAVSIAPHDKESTRILFWDTFAELEQHFLNSLPR